MSDPVVNIYHLFPSLLNLHGDKGNIAVLSKRCAWRGIDANVVDAESVSEISFDNADIVLLGGGGKNEVFNVLQSLLPIADRIRKYIENGGILLAVCEGYHMLGECFNIADETTAGLGILDIATVAGERRLAENLIIKTTIASQSVTLVGFENHIGYTDIREHTPFGKVVYGYGNNASSGHEGVWHKNLIGTNMHGPLLPKSPELCDHMLLTALTKKYGQIFERGLMPLGDKIEFEARRFVEHRQSEAYSASK